MLHDSVKRHLTTVPHRRFTIEKSALSLLASETVLLYKKETIP